VRSRWYETLALLLVTFTLFRPGFWWDMVYEPYRQLPATQLMAQIEKAPAEARLRVWIEGTSLDGDAVRKGVLLPLGDVAPARQRLAGIGLTLSTLGDQVQVAAVKFGSKAEKLGLEQSFQITAVEIEADRPDKEWMFLPAAALLLIVLLMQRRRLRPSGS